MKKVLLALIVIFFASQGLAEKITFITEEYPPYEYTEKGIWKGTDVDIIKEVCKRIDCQPVFENYPWKRAIMMVKEGRSHAIFSLFKTDERLKYLYFPDKPISYDRNVIIAPADSNLSITKLQDLNDLKVGVISEYSYGKIFDN